MTLVQRIVKLVGALVAFSLYVWFAAVRNAPRVKARKAQRQAQRLAQSRRRR